MEITRYALSLRASHPDMPVAAIVETVGLPPDVTATAGGPRQFLRTGRVGVRSRQTYATFGCGRGDGHDLVRCMEDVLEHLERRRGALLALHADGVRFEFFVGLFLEGNEGLTLDPALLRRMAALEIELGLDIYPPDRAQAGVMDRW